MGHRRFARHWSVPQIRAELRDAHRISLSADAISVYLHRYQTMVAARQQDPQQLAKAYQRIDSLVLSIDGLQPEKGHEVLYAVRELNAKRVWFAEALLSSNQDEVRRLLVRAREFAARLGKPVRLWLSDKQDAFVKGIPLEFPGVPHRYCVNHFLRDLAEPMLDADSHAKVKMRSQVRGLRDIEREVLKQRRRDDTKVESPQEVKTRGVVPPDAAARVANPQRANAAQASQADRETVGAEGSDTAGTKTRDQASQVVLDYCAVVRGILNDDQGGPLHPPGLRMAEALAEVRASLGRNLKLNKPEPAHGQLEQLVGCIDRGLAEVKAQQQQLQEQVQAIGEVAQTLEESAGTMAKRRVKYQRLRRQYEKEGGAFYSHLSKVMLSFAAGLFVPVRTRKGEKLPSDNLDLERWFRKPKGHERRIHGHKHAGVRIVQEGATLVLVLDAHEEHAAPFTVEDLLPYRHAEMPTDQQEALQRRKIMRKARSKKNDQSFYQS
jgi:prefoldin subunit 5